MHNGTGSHPVVYIINTHSQQKLHSLHCSCVFWHHNRTHVDRREPTEILCCISGSCILIFTGIINFNLKKSSLSVLRKLVFFIIIEDSSTKLLCSHIDLRSIPCYSKTVQVHIHKHSQPWMFNVTGSHPVVYIIIEHSQRKLHSFHCNCRLWNHRRTRVGRRDVTKILCRLSGK